MVIARGEHIGWLHVGRRPTIKRGHAGCRGDIPLWQAVQKHKILDIDGEKQAILPKQDAAASRREEHSFEGLRGFLGTMPVDTRKIPSHVTAKRLDVLWAISY